MKKIRRILIAAFAVGGLAAVATPAGAIIGRPLTPMSYAGVARRTVRRSAYVGAAAVGTAAAVGVGTAAAVAALPHGCYPGAPCGGVVYQPMYSGTTLVYVPR